MDVDHGDHGDGAAATGETGAGAGSEARHGAEAVPCDCRNDGTLRFVWDLPHGRIVIDVRPDGTVAVNGRAVDPVPARRPSAPVADAA